MGDHCRLLPDSTVASNVATVFIILKDWEQRNDPSLSHEGILADVRKKFSQIQDGIVYAFLPPAITGLGVSGGFQMQVEDRGGVGLSQLQLMVQEILQAGNAQSGLTALNTHLSSQCAATVSDIDRVKAKTLDSPRQCFRHPSDLPRLYLCQRFQQIRTHLSGQCSGRLSCSASCQTSSALMCAIWTGIWCPLGPW